MTNRSKPLRVHVVGGESDVIYARMFLQQGGFAMAGDIKSSDIVVFRGGGDIDPALYKENQLLKCRGVSKERDEIEIDAYTEALCEGKFLVGICRGAQLLNVMNGGKLWQDVDGHNKTHQAIIVKTGKSIEVSSSHHQMMRMASGAELIASARVSTERIAHGFEESGILCDPEVVWYEATRSLCFQPHPEWGTYYKATQELFFDSIREKGEF